MFKRLEYGCYDNNGKWGLKKNFINLDLVAEIDENRREVFLTNGNQYDLTEDSMKELVKALEEPSAEERIATAIESALDCGNGLYCKCIVSNM